MTWAPASRCGPVPVAVIIPAFNAQDTLDAALASVAAQTRQPRTVVVIDDGSTDETAGVAERWRASIPICVLQQSQSGPGPARRAAIESTHEPLLALLDADDCWLPDHLQTLLAIHAVTGGIVTADALPWSPGSSLGQSYRSSFPVPPPEEQAVRIVHGNFVFIGSLFSRQDYEAAGGFRSFAPGAEDWDLWIRMIRGGARVHSAAHPTCLYRLSATGLTAKVDIMDRYLAVLEAAVQETDDAAELSAARWGLQMCRARRSIRRSYEAAGAGRTMAARGQALAGLRGSWLHKLQSLAIVTSPRAALWLRNRLKRL